MKAAATTTVTRIQIGIKMVRTVGSTFSHSLAMCHTTFFVHMCTFCAYSCYYTTEHNSNNNSNNNRYPRRTYTMANDADDDNDDDDDDDDVDDDGDDDGDDDSRKKKRVEWARRKWKSRMKMKGK